MQSTQSDRPGTDRSLEELLAETSIEDIEAAKHARSTTDPTVRKRCPECGTPNIERRRNPEWGSKPDVDATYRCCNNGCLELFDDPVREGEGR